MSNSLPDRYGVTVFCDDIREELGGKSTYVGCYKGTMYIHGELPTALPKLGIAVILKQRFPFVHLHPKIRIYLPGDPDDKPSIDSSTNVKIDPTQQTEDGEISETYLNFLFSPLLIKSEGQIKVRAICDGEIVRLGRLSIKRRALSVE